jgi:hypothetical protein
VQDNHIERLFRFLSTRTTTVLGGTLSLHINTASVRLSDCADDDGARKQNNEASKRQYIKHGAYESGCGQMDVQVSRKTADGDMRTAWTRRARGDVAQITKHCVAKQSPAKKGPHRILTC